MQSAFSPDTTLPVPFVNMNGQSAKNLVEEQLNAMHAIQAAKSALCERAPHGRDYFTAPTGVYDAARAHHVAMLSALDKIETDLEQIAMAIQDQA